MSRTNLADVASLVEAINERHLEGVSELLDGEFEFHAAIGAVEQRVYAGAEGLRAFVADMDSTWDGYRIELTDVRVAGARAVALMRLSGTARVSGIPLDQEVAQVIAWRDGRLWRVVAYTAPAEALRAVELEA